jgi:mono/diheme cytochrome c family protein
MPTNPLKTLFLSALLILILAACSGESSQGSPAASNPPGAAGEVSFAADVLPIFEQSCTRCHGSSRQSSGLRLDIYAALMTGGKDGAVVVPNDAANSLLVELITSGKMPRNAASLPTEKITLITDWVNAGALDN